MATITAGIGSLASGATVDRAVAGVAGASFYKIFDFQSGAFITGGVPASSTAGSWVRASALSDLNFGGGRYAVKAFDANAGSQTGFAFGNVTSGAGATSQVRVGAERLAPNATVSLDELIDASDLRSQDSVKVIAQRSGSTVLDTGFISASDLGNESFNTGSDGTQTNVFVRTFISGNGQTGYARNTLTADSAAPPPGTTFQLTTGVDAGSNFTGSGGDDTFIGSVSGPGNDTLTAGDDLNGGGGRDELRITVVDKAIDLGIPDLASIERVDIRSKNTTTQDIDLADAAGMFESASVDLDGREQTSDFAVQNIHPDTTFTLANGDGDGATVSVEYQDLAASGGNPPIDATIKLRDLDDVNFQADFDVAGNGTSDSDQVTLNLSGLENTDGGMVGPGDAAAIENWTVNVDAPSVMQNLDLDGFDASDESNGQTIDLNVNADLTIAGELDADQGVDGDQTVNITADGDLSVNNGKFLNADAGESVTININGGGNVELGNLDDGEGRDNAKVIDASSATGAVRLKGVGETFSSVKTGSGNDFITAIAGRTVGSLSELTSTMGPGTDVIAHNAGTTGLLRSKVTDFEFGTDRLGVDDDVFDGSGLTNTSEVAAFVNDALGAGTASAGDVTVLQAGAATNTGNSSAVFEFNGSTHVVGSDDQAFDNGDVFITLMGVTDGANDGSDVATFFNEAISFPDPGGGLI